jgi:hypothetical protein
MTNAINNIKDAGAVIAKLSAAMLADKVQFIKSIDKEPESTFNSQVNGFNPGQTIYVNKPARFVPTTNADITSSIQDVVEEKVAVTLNIRQVQAVALTSLEVQNSLALKDWSKRILDPAISSIAQGVESTVLTSAKNAVYNLVGSAGTTVFDTDTVLSAGERLAFGLAPQDGDQYLLLNPTANRSAVNARKGLFQSSSAIADQYKKGYIGDADGFTFLRNSMLPTHTRGTQTSTFTVTTTSTEADSTLALTGTSGGTLKAGDVFTIASVFAVHPITKATLNYLQQFVVTANNTAVSTAYSGVAISPSIYAASNGLQNVSALPQSSAAVTIVGNLSTGYVQNLAYHKSAFRFVSVPLMKPNGAHMVGQETVDGMTVRVWMDSAILTDKMIMRIDLLGGFAAVRPEWACRITA